MTINQVRTVLYMVAKFLGDLAAIKKAVTTGSARPLWTRVLRRGAGKATGRLLGRLPR
jgi:hypothetical protein